MFLLADWYGATQWLVAIGFYGTNLSLFLVALYMFVRSCTKDCELGVAAAIIAIFTGNICGLIITVESISLLYLLFIS